MQGMSSNIILIVYSKVLQDLTGWMGSGPSGRYLIISYSLWSSLATWSWKPSFH